MTQREAMQRALDFIEHCWRDVSLNEHSENMRSNAEDALTTALELLDDPAQSVIVSQPVIAPAKLVATVRAKSDAYGGTFVMWETLPVAGMKLYTTPQPFIVPEGWKLVPIEPTQEMLEAGVKEQHGPAAYKAVSRAGCSTLEGEQYANYQAILAASPTTFQPVVAPTQSPVHGERV